MAIDWKALQNRLEVSNPTAAEESMEPRGRRRALEILIREENLRDAVDQFISLQPGVFTAEMVLRPGRNGHNRMAYSWAMRPDRGLR
jgi:hypothetical protein